MSGMTRTRRNWLVAEPIVLMLAVIATSWAVYLFGRPAFPFVARHYDDINTALFLYAPLMPILFGRGGSPEDPTQLADYGLTLRRPLTILAVLAATLAVVAPLFTAVMYLASLYGPAWFRPPFELHVPDAIGGVMFFQLVQVALPEEFFFRGYAQGRLDMAFLGRVNILGAPVGWGMIWANALFAVAHPLQVGPHLLGSWARLETFLPGLLFGWLRARTGSMVAPMLMHLASNLLLFAVIRGG